MPLQTDSILFDVLSADPASPVEGQMWFNTTDKTLKVYRTAGGTSAVQAKTNITTTDPLVTSDSASGYAIGSRWINTATSNEFVCTDATVGAAVWKNSTGTSNARLLEKFISSPAEGWPSGIYREVTGGVFPSALTWWTSSAKTTKVVEAVYTRNGAQQATTVQWKMYASNGTTVLSTITDTIVYTNGAESSRTRTIA
jgi:hypothetical protein